MSVEGMMSQTDAHHDTHTRLHGRALFFARAVWFIAVVLVLGLYALSIPLQAQVLQTACTDNCQFGQLTAARIQELAQLGLSLYFYIAYQLALNTIFFLVFVTVGGLIFWRKSNDWFGIYVALALVLFGIGFSNPLLLIGEQYPTFYIPVLILNGIGSTMIGIFFYLFPDGRFVPRWTRWLIPLVAAREFGNIFAPDFSDSLLGSVAFLIELASYLFAQIYRYRRVSNPVERQQTKWFVYGATVGLLGFAGLILFVRLTSPTSQPTSVIVDLIEGAALYFFVLLIPLSILMAILRYRLWDIDLLINRTLVYVPLTAMLAGIFAASITLSQKVFIAFTGQSSDAATVLTTLVVVAAFEPLKSGIQHLVDLRLKEPRDPARHLSAYNEELRSFVQMMDMGQNLRRLLDETVRAFDAAGGAVFSQRDGNLQLVHSVGQWNGQAAVSIPLEANGVRIGVLELSARNNGADYSAADRATLQQSSELVARAVALTERMDGVKKWVRK